MESNSHSPLSTWPLPTWNFTNLTLAAFYYHPDLDVARAKWAVSRAAKITAGERPNPSLGVVPGYSATTSIPSPWLVTPTLDIPIETAGKRGYRIAQSSHLSEAARLGIASVAWQVRSRVRRSLLDLYSATETQSVLAEQLTMLAENERLIQGQHEAGAVSAFELSQARTASINARLALRDAEAQSADARVQLADAVGIPAAALEGIHLNFESAASLPEIVPTAAVRKQALLNRADVLSALSEYAATQSALQLEIAKQYPDVHLNPGYEFDQGNSKWSLGLTVTLPVLNQNKGAIAEAMAQREVSAANFYALQARVVSEIDRAIATYRLAQKKKIDIDALLANLKAQQKTYQGMFEAGEISKVELAAQRLQISTASLARLDAVAKSRLALGQLEDALQSPLGISDAAWQESPRPSEVTQSDKRP